MVLKDSEDHWEKWHLCPKCEAVETGQTEADVMETTFKKPTEHKKNRVQHFKEVIEKKKKNLLKSQKKNLQEREATASKCGKENLLKSTKKSSSLQEDEELEVGHGLVSATLVSANVVSANLVPFILFTNRGLSTNRCCVLKSAEEH